MLKCKKKKVIPNKARGKADTWAGELGRERKKMNKTKGTPNLFLKIKKGHLRIRMMKNDGKTK